MVVALALDDAARVEAVSAELENEAANVHAAALFLGGAVPRMANFVATKDDDVAEAIHKILAAKT